MGGNALDANTTGGSNVAVGNNALGNCTTASNNTAVGKSALSDSTTGNSNTAVGSGALDAITTTSYNTAIGRDAGGACTGAENTFLGQQAGNSSTSANNCIHIGYNSGNSNESNTITIGTDITSYGSTHVTLGTNGHGRVYVDFSSNASWARTSDERKKKDIATNTDCGLNFINDLRTVTYKWKAPSELPNTFVGYDANETEPSYKNKMYGFIAQEVKATMDKHNITDFAGWNESKEGEQGVSYEMFVMPLVKAVQELSAEVEQLKSQINN